ncbi:putative transcriptional regulator domain protein [Thauera sp. SWB20]|nr:putative transcriptional regulator domain protein [Thauera sp. SWB20]
MALVHGQQGLRKVWQFGSELTQLGQWHSGCGLRHRRERIPQLGQQPRLFIFRKLLDVNTQHAVNLEQHRDSQRTLVLLDLVQIARRQLQCLSQRCLGHAALGTQAAQAHAHESLGHGNCSLCDSQNLQTSQINCFCFAMIRQFSSIRLKCKCVDCEVWQIIAGTKRLDRPSPHFRRHA